MENKLFLKRYITIVLIVALMILLAAVLGNAQPDLRKVMLGYDFQPEKVEVKRHSWMLPTPKEAGGLGLLLLASFTDGVLEGWSFDGRTSFERIGADPEGFWGSQSWRKVYVNGNPEEGFKSKLHEWTGAMDFYHIADDTRKYTYIFGGYITLHEIFHRPYRRKWHKWGRLAGTLALSSFAKRQGMKWVRNVGK